jgi:hypothetical protein
MRASKRRPAHIPARRRRKPPSTPGNPRNATIEKLLLVQGSPAILLGPETTKTGLSRRRSRVRVRLSYKLPANPNLLMPGAAPRTTAFFFIQRISAGTLIDTASYSHG